MASRISKTEWTILLVVAASLDFIQFVVIECILVWFFGLGAAINEVLDPIISVATIGYLTMRKVNLIKYPSRILSMIGVQGLETLTGGIAQFWFLEILYLRSSVIKEDAAERAAEEQESIIAATIQQPLYKNGVRQPRTGTTSSSRPMNMSGVRAPSGALIRNINLSPGTNRVTTGSSMRTSNTFTGPLSNTGTDSTPQTVPEEMADVVA
jgi:hypothetical protein